MDQTWYPQRKSADACTALLKTFVHHLGFDISRSTIEQDTEAHPEYPALSFEAITEILEQWGLLTTAYMLNAEKLPVIPFPSLTLITETAAGITAGTYVVLHSMEVDQLVYIHPAKGWVYESLESFSAKWSGALLSPVEMLRDGEPDFEEKERRYEELKYANPDLSIVKLFEGFLTPGQCDHIIQLSKDKFDRSEVESDVQDVNRGRSSYSAYLTQTDDPVLSAVRKKCSALINMPEEQFEPFQCVSYKTGQEYRNHYDTFDAATEAGKQQIREGGQRKYTILAYLNDDFEGGGTYFPKLDLLLQPKKGRIVIFQNTDDNGRVIDHSFHAGLPVTKGWKYALNIWVRDGGK